MKKACSKRGGFTLLEISIVIAIMATVMMGGAMLFASYLQQREIDDTNIKLQTIQQALLDFRRVYNRLPCPADVTQANTSSTYGTESGVPGTSCSANFNDGGNNYEGMVPTKALNLTDEYAVDGWGRRFMYIVDYRMTLTNAFITISMTDTTTRMTINDYSGTARTTFAAYVLLSFGPDGHGAYPRNGGTTRVSASLNAANTNSLTNCHCNSDGTNGTFAGTFVQSIAYQNPAHVDHTYDFDDIVLYATRRQLRSLTE